MKKQIVRDYLTFNKRERNGVFILIAIITFLLIYLNVSDHFPAKEKVDFSKFEKEIDSLDKAQVAEKEEGENYGERTTALPKHEERAGPKTERFDFDPNHLPEKEWKRLGLSDKQIKIINNYESKGGTFRRKEDVKKMYCIKDDLYNSLEPYIRIPAAPSVFEHGKVEKPNTAQPLVPAISVTVELNTADSAMLTTIKGIGPFYAKSIIKYRNSIGGFYSKEQLMEVWKFDQEKYDAVQKYVTADASMIKKININTCEADQLKGQYLRWNVANAIVNYRKQHGPFKTIDDIKKTDLVDDETLRKIAPYLIVDL